MMETVAQQSNDVGYEIVRTVNQEQYREDKLQAAEGLAALSKK